MNGSPEWNGARGIDRAPSPGDTVGPYQLLFRAAEGGMATVWAARLRGSHGFQQIVAVKVLSDALREDPDGRAMFLDEARTAARIHHPNVGQILDYGEDGGRPYLTMEWIEGESLARIATAQRTRGGRLPLRWVLQVATAACAGLHAAHEARDDDGEPMNLVHRDVSPQNVMVTFDGFTKVVDFGVAKSRRRAQVTRVGVMKGKTGYFSPEQIAGRELDRRADLFAFGVLLYLMVTDHHPFRGRCAIETVQNIATREPFAPRELVPDLPRPLDELILRALSKDPAHRFATAAELGRELEQIAVALGGPLPDRSVGALVQTLLPAASGNRRSRLARAAKLLDRARAQAAARAHAQPAPGGPEPVGVEITLSTPIPPAHPAAKHEDPTQPEAPASSLRGAAVPASAPPSRAAQRPSLGALPGLLLLGAAAIAARAGEHLGIDGRAARAANAGVAQVAERAMSRSTTLLEATVHAAMSRAIRERDDIQRRAPAPPAAHPASARPPRRDARPAPTTPTASTAPTVTPRPARAAPGSPPSPPRPASPAAPAPRPRSSSPRG